MTKAKRLIRWADCPKCKVETEYKFSTDVYQTAIYQCPKCKSIYTERALESNALLVRQGKDDKAKKTSWEREFDEKIRLEEPEGWWKSDLVDETELIEEKVKAFIRQVRQEAVEEAIGFMKGKVIDMPVGSGIPLVVSEAQVIGWLTKDKKESPNG